MTDLYQKYVEITKKIAELEEIQTSLRKLISEELPEEGFKDETITAFWKSKKSWKYSPKVEALAENLKTEKKLEEETGVATCEESKQLTITVK